MARSTSALRASWTCTEIWRRRGPAPEHRIWVVRSALERPRNPSGSFILEENRLGPDRDRRSADLKLFACQNSVTRESTIGRIRNSAASAAAARLGAVPDGERFVAARAV